MPTPKLDIHPGITKGEFEILKRVIKDPFYFSTFSRVVHPVKGKVPFNLYDFQKKTLYYFLRYRFNIVLKFRQAGLTELISLYCLWLAMYHNSKNIQIISIKDRVAKKVLRRIKFIYRNLPDYLKIPVINGRASEIGTGTEMEFSNGSTITSIPTTEHAGRSEAVSLLVIDEAAIVRWANQILAAALPTLSTGGSAILNSCVTGDTNIISRKGLLRIDSICPKEFGKIDVSHLGIEVLSHKGKWQKVVGAINKGQLETWEIESDYGKRLKCTPNHKLLTPHGWRSVKDIVKKGLYIVTYDAESFIGDIPKGYVVDHINNNPEDNYVTNLEIVSIAENTMRATKYSYGLKMGSRVGSGFANIKLIGKIRKAHLKGKKITEIADKYDVSLSYVSRIISNKRVSGTQISKIKVIRKYLDNIYDISVSEDQSYITDSAFVNHNTPFGIGNLFHKTWVDAVAQGNEFFPIRLYWWMHPERDDHWYKTMAATLGPRRTAQEIDGDFLTSGNSVFDLVDIKAIEDSLTEVEIFDKRENGGLIMVSPPKKNERYYLGADVASGRSRDFSAYSIMNGKGDEYSYYKGKLNVGKFAELLMREGKRYNNALIAPESNDIGLAVTTKIQEHGYTNLYYSKRFLKEKGNSKPKVEKIPGWYTTMKNRPIIIEELETDIRNDLIYITNKFFVQEAYTFIYDERNRPVAMGKSSRATSEEDILDAGENSYTDDSIMAEAITNFIRKGKQYGSVVPPQ